MRKMPVSFIVAGCFISSSSGVYAEERQFRKPALWHIAALPAYLFLELNMHEGSHALAFMSQGLRMESYRPYPHIEHHFGGKNSYFVFGSARARCPTRERCFNNEQSAFFLLAPYITQCIFFVASDIFLSSSQNLRESFFGPVIFIAGMLAPWVDFVFNLNGLSNNGDFARASEALGVRRGFSLLVGNFIALIGVWRLINRGLRVFSERIEPENISANRIFISPIVGDINGLSFLSAF